jgi:archaellin
VRTYKFTFIIECASEGKPNLARVEELIDLNMQDLVMDDEFVVALDESESVTIQVIPQFGQTDSNSG